MGFPRQEYWSRLPFPSPGTVYQISIKKRKIGHGEKSTIKTEQVQWVCKQHRQIPDQRKSCPEGRLTHSRHTFSRQQREERMKGWGWRRMENAIGQFLRSSWRREQQLQAQSRIPNKAPCSKIIKNSKMIITGHEALWGCSAVHPCSWPWHPKLLPGTPVLSGHCGPELKRAVPSILPQVPNTHKGCVPNVRLCVGPLNLSLCLLAPE